MYFVLIFFNKIFVTYTKKEKKKNKDKEKQLYARVTAIVVSEQEAAT